MRRLTAKPVPPGSSTSEPQNFPKMMSRLAGIYHSLGGFWKIPET